jgi:nitrite reductase (NADH) small subunit
MSDWIAVCAISDIPVLGARRVTREKGLDVAIFRTQQDAIFALLDRCPHKGGPLSQGIVFGNSVACPLHNWTIDLAEGRATGADEGCTPFFSVRVQGDSVYLNIEELRTRAIDSVRPLAGPGRELKN